MEKGPEMFALVTQIPQSRPGWMDNLDRLAAIDGANALALWANRALILFILLFTLSVPHSIAAAQVSFTLGAIFWAIRDLALRRLHFARVPIDWPLLAFAALTVLSSVYSFEPNLSLPKLKALTLFGVVYLLVTNLSHRGVSLVTWLLIVSALVGAGFSFAEKVYGRGMVITAIEAGSPLASSHLQPGDVIWMIARRRVHSPEDAAAVIRRHKIGDKLDVEALRAGDPLPATLTVTEELKAGQNPLGVKVNGRSRQFRISGFLRQFQTYAEQMQILALLAFGGLLTGIKLWRKRPARTKLAIFSLLFVVFALALVLTASRAVIVTCILALLLVSISFGGRLAQALTLCAALLLGGAGYYVIKITRMPVTLDDSARLRRDYMQAGLRAIPQHPLLGVGMDSTKRHWQEWGFPGEYITHTHSTPIQIALDRGLPALGCYVWLILAMMIMAWRGYRRSREDADDLGEILALGSFGALIGFSLSSLTNYNFGDSEVLMLLLFVSGLSAVRSKLAKSK